MPLSSVIGSSSIMQPGVCTSTTRPASPYDGQVIYETDTNLLCIWNGSAWKTIAFSDYTSGAVLQVVNTRKTDDWVATTGTTYTDVTGLSASITPSSASNKILVTISLCASSDGGNFGYARMLRGATEIGASQNPGFGGFGSVLHDGGSSGGNYYKTISTSILDSPSTTSATTYKIQMCHHSAGGIVSVNRRAGFTGIFGTSTITLQEIAG